MFCFAAPNLHEADSDAVAPLEQSEHRAIGDGKPPILEKQERIREEAIEKAEESIGLSRSQHVQREEMAETDEVDVTTIRSGACNRGILGTWMEDDFLEDSAYGGAMGQVSFLEEDEDPLGPLGLPTVGTRAKWSLLGGPVRCPECFRSFANTGRLERHLSGFHSSYGTHHCVLCGNRFKYDYNLLYHYRRSCPYTKVFMDRDVREQMDAPSLRKLVRNLAQKEVRLTPQVEPPPRLPGRAAPQPQMAIRYPSKHPRPPAHVLVPPKPGFPSGERRNLFCFKFLQLQFCEQEEFLAHLHRFL